MVVMWICTECNTQRLDRGELFTACPDCHLEMIRQSPTPSTWTLSWWWWLVIGWTLVIVMLNLLFGCATSLEREIYAARAEAEATGQDPDAAAGDAAIRAFIDHVQLED